MKSVNGSAHIQEEGIIPDSKYEEARIIDIILSLYTIFILNAIVQLLL